MIFGGIQEGVWPINNQKHRGYAVVRLSPVIELLALPPENLWVLPHFLSVFWDLAPPLRPGRGCFVLPDIYDNTRVGE